MLRRSIEVLPRTSDFMRENAATTTPTLMMRLVIVIPTARFVRQDVQESKKLAFGRDARAGLG
jgi:hypothetical protein